MHRQAYIPPGAGKNFISLHCLWDSDKSNIISYQEQVNEFAVLGQTSTLWDYRKLRGIIDGIDAIERFETKNPGIVNWLLPFRERVSKDWLLTRAKNAGSTEQALHNLERDWYWLPIFDFSIFFLSFFGKDEELDKVINELCSLPWSVHNIGKRNLTSIIHYSPNDTLGMVDVKKEIRTMRISIKDCEEYISDLLYVKHSIPVQHETNKGNYVAEERFYLRDPGTIVDENISYSKLFMNRDKVEIERLFEYFGKEEHFHNNKSTILKDFAKYDVTNRKLVDNFDFSNIPGYEKTFFKGWKDLHYGK